MANATPRELELKSEVERLRERIIELENERQTALAQVEERSRKLLATVQEEKDRLSAVIASMSDEVWFAGVDKHFELANPSARQEFNLTGAGSINIENLAGSLEIYRADGTPRPVEDAPLLRALKGESIRNEEEIIRTPGSGQLRHRQVSAAPVKDASGNVVGSVCVVRDISARRQAEEALKNQREWLKVTLNSIGDAVLAAGVDGKITFLNGVAARLTGWNEAEALGRPVADVFKILNEKTRAAGDDVIARVLQEKGVVALANNTALVTRDGREIPIEDSAAPIRDEAGNVTGVVLVFHDVTARRRAQDALAATHAETANEKNRLAALMEALPVGVALTDAKGGRIDSNREFEKIWGSPTLPTRSVSDYAAYKAWWVANGQPVQPEEWASARAVQKGETIVNQEMEIQRFDGTCAFVLNSAAPISDSQGKIVGSAVAIMDITEQKRSEEALRESERRLAFALETTGTGAWDLDLVDHTAHRSLMHDSIFGYQSLLPRWTFEMFLDHVLPEDREEVNRKFTHAVQTKTDWNFECRIRRVDGEVRWISAAGRHQPDSNGELRRMSGVVQDITERKLAEEALRESEAQFRTLANAIPQLCWMANADGWIFWYNQRWYEYTGATPAQMEGWGWQSVHDPKVLPEVLGCWKASLDKGEPFDMVFPLRGADGVYRPFLTRGMPVRDRDGKVVRWFGTNTDISAQREREEAAIQASEQLRMALEAAQMGAWDYRFDTGEVFWDERCSRMFGLPEGEVRDDDAIARMHPSDQDSVRRALAQALAGVDGGTYDVEFRVNWPDGSEHWITSHGRVYFTGEGAQRKAVRFIGVNLDITNRKLAEKGLREAQKLESLGLLAGGVAHDFNNLLVGVIGNASLAQDILPPDHPAAELLQAVVKSGEQAAHLTRQMLAYSGKGKFLMEFLNLSAMIPENVGLVRPSISKKIALHLEMNPELPFIEADRGQLQQVVMNLVLNAAEAMGSDDGVVTVRTGARFVDDAYLHLNPEASGLRPGEYVFLEVRDTGCGMDDATRARIFDPFFSTKFTGRGLGLAAVAGIVRGHNGAILVSSAPGQGSTFTVLLPSAAPPADQPEASVPRKELKGSGVVLVVDDEAVVREMAKRALERYGYEVLLADSGAAAIDALRRHPSDIALVILDLSMPKMGGEQALRELRKIRPEVKVIVSSGYNEAETMALFTGQRVSGFVQKPYVAATLAEKVKLTLG